MNRSRSRSRSRRKLLLGGCALFSLLINSSHNLRAQSSAPVPNPVSPITGVDSSSKPIWTSGWDSAWRTKMDASRKEIILATNYGVLADAILNNNGVGVKSGTDDTQALNAALNYCTSVGGKLLLPPGNILIAGGGAANITSKLKNCGIEGTGAIGGDSPIDEPNVGTTILITSTSVKPFAAYQNFSFVGVTFYHPNQPVVKDSIIAYPPVISPPGQETDTTEHWYMDHVTFVNPYDAIAVGGGAFFITHSLLYALHDFLRAGNIGDSFHVTDNHFTPGPWYRLTNFAPANTSTGAMGTIIDNKNTQLHAMPGAAGQGNAVNAVWVHNSAFAWGYGLKIENGVTVGISEFDWTFDGVGTVIDSSSGGIYAGFSGPPMRGGAGCGRAYTYHPELNNAPCFNMGPHSTLDLSGWTGSSKGSFISAVDGIVHLTDVKVSNFGEIADGSDYCLVFMGATTGGAVISIKNGEFQGRPNDIHVHGIVTQDQISRLIVEGNAFSYFYQIIDAKSGAGTTLISGNWSIGISQFSVDADKMASGNTGVIYNSNNFEKPPLATFSSGGCGTGATVQAGFAGTIFVGSGSPTDCFITLPWHVFGSGGGACQGTANGGGIAINMSLTGNDREWHITGTDSSGAPKLPGQIFYACYGQQ
jgi:hypothetical protein